MPKSYKIADNLYLVQQEVPRSGPPPKKVDVATNHIAVIDCSGSMYGDLPQIREQLKNRLPKLLKENDTISIVWFSGRGQFGTLIEAEPVATLADLQEVNKAIDRWIKSIGLTGFKEPLEEVGKLTERIAKKNKNPFGLFFMSDGCDNQWSRAEILKTVEHVGGKLASATFVEYGYYADRPLLTAMAEKAGGSLIFAEDFDKYAPTFEAAILKKISGAPRIEVDIPGDTIGGFAWTQGDGELVTYAVEAGTVRVAESSSEVWYLSPSRHGSTEALTDLARKKATNPGMDAAYAAMSLFSVRMQPNVVYPILKALGDVKYIDQFSGCFGKQKYSEFMTTAQKAVFDHQARYVNGYDPDKVPSDDAFTVFDLLEVLSGDVANRILLDSPDFKYNRIGRGRVDASDQLTAEEQKEIAELTAKMASVKDAKKLKELTDKIAAITNSKPAALKFEADKQPNGYPISSLTFNEERPNISFLVRKTGSVDLTARLEKEDPAIEVPTNFPSFIFRNYSVIKDGLINVKRLPVRLTAGTIRALREKGMPLSAVTNPEGESIDETVTRVKKAADGREVNVVFDLERLPVINRQMIASASAQVLFEKEYELSEARAAQKVYNTYKKERAPRESKGFKEQYGEAAAAWLKDQGITDYSGFNPKSVQAESTDFYMGKELKVSLKGLSSLPSVKEVKEKMSKGKLTPSAALMAPYVKEVEDYLATNPTAEASAKWLEEKFEAAQEKVRGLILDMARIKFAVVVGQIWFKEFKSLDENTLKIKAGGNEVEGKVEMREIEIKI